LTVPPSFANTKDMAATTATRRKKKSTSKKAPRRMSNAQLLKLAEKHRPPQSWFEQNDLPFTPTKD
jgi:hypothetical protein